MYSRHSYLLYFSIKEEKEKSDWNYWTQPLTVSGTEPSFFALARRHGPSVFTELFPSLHSCVRMLVNGKGCRDTSQQTLCHWNL